MHKDLKIVSPITGSREVEKINQYPVSITSDSKLIRAPVDNFLCLQSGLIFNASGARGSELDFYSDSYELHNESAVSEFMRYGDDGKHGIYRKILEFIEHFVELSSVDSLLEIGAGKGLFLKELMSKYPKIQVSACEPSKNASTYFQKTMPSVSLFNGDFESSPFGSEKYKFIAANGVLEHLPDPSGFLYMVKKCLEKDGFAYFGVPNFSTNPADLFTYDHLSRFTEDSLKYLFDFVGLEIIASDVSEKRVPMWFLVKHGDESRNKNGGSILSSSRELISSHLDYINRSFAAFDKCAAESKKSGGKVGVYGTGTIWRLGAELTSLDSSKVDVIFDDNSSIWGSARNGVEVCNPEMIRKLGIKHICVSANPCYHNLIIEQIHRISPDTLIYL